MFSFISLRDLRTSIVFVKVDLMSFVFQLCYTLMACCSKIVGLYWRQNCLGYYCLCLFLFFLMASRYMGLRRLPFYVLDSNLVFVGYIFCYLISISLVFRRL